MSDNNNANHEYREKLRLQASIQQAIGAQFAAEDEGLRHALSAAREQGLPEIQISPIQGKCYRCWRQRVMRATF